MSNTLKIVFLLILILAISGMKVLLTGTPVKSSVQFGVKTEYAFVDNPNRLRVRFDDESTGHKNYINKEQTSGWRGKWNFPRSGILTARACLAPNLIGFVDVDKSEAPEIEKYIELVEAVPLKLNIRSPKSGIYSFEQYKASQEKLKIGIENSAGSLPILSVCDVKFSYLPKADFSKHFKLKNGILDMHSNRVDYWEFDLADENLDQISITVLGLTEENGKRFGFTATGTLKVVYKPAK